MAGLELDLLIIYKPQTLTPNPETLTLPPKPHIPALFKKPHIEIPEQTPEALNKLAPCARLLVKISGSICVFEAALSINPDTVEAQKLDTQ